MAAALVALLMAPAALAKGPAQAARPATARAAHPAKTAKAREPEGRSVGSPTEGHLVGGVRLEEGTALRVAPAYTGGDVRYGTRQLVHLVDRASKRVKQQFPDAVLTVGHLSKLGGGELDHHASHESGRDADLGFYVKSGAGKPLYAPAFVAFAGDGKARTWPGAHFDDAKNWALVEALVLDPEARVTHLFVAQPLRDRLMAFAQRTGVRESTRVRVSEVLAQPHGALPHDDHFHVRIACPGSAQGCIENPARRTARAAAAAAKKAPHGAHAHAAHPGQGTHPHRGSAPAKPTAHAAPAPHRARGATPAPRPAKPPVTRDDDDDTESRDSAPKAAPTAGAEASVPRLGPVVPGLDSAVIPAPIDDVDGQ